MIMSEKILVVDDEQEIANLVELYLQNGNTPSLSTSGTCGKKWGIRRIIPSILKLSGGLE